LVRNPVCRTVSTNSAFFPCPIAQSPRNAIQTTRRFLIRDTHGYRRVIGENVKSLNPTQPSRPDGGGYRKAWRRTDFLRGTLGIPLHGLKRGQDDNIEAPVLRASGGGVVAGNWVKLAITCGRQVTRGQFELHDQQPDHFRGSSRRKFPIRSKV